MPADFINAYVLANVGIASSSVAACADDNVIEHPHRRPNGRLKHGFIQSPVDDMSG